MNAGQMATYEMAHAVQTHIEANGPAWDKSVPFTNAYSAFKELLHTLDGYVPKQQERPTDITAKRKAKTLSLRGHLLDLVTGMRGYAYDHSLPDVLARVNYSPTDIARLVMDDLSAVAQALHDWVDGLLAATPAPPLGDYDITMATQAALAQDIADFNDLKGAPKAANAPATEATAKIAELLTQITDALDNRLDNAAALLRRKQPDFIAQYFVARRVDDAGHATMAMTISVKDEEGAPVANAAVTLSNGLKRKTTEKGACQILHLPDGTYTVMVRKEGWEEATQQVSTTKGETAHVEVVLGKK